MVSFFSFLCCCHGIAGQLGWFCFVVLIKTPGINIHAYMEVTCSLARAWSAFSVLSVIATSSTPTRSDCVPWTGSWFLHVIRWLEHPATGRWRAARRLGTSSASQRQPAPCPSFPQSPPMFGPANLIEPTHLICPQASQQASDAKPPFAGIYDSGFVELDPVPPTKPRRAGFTKYRPPLPLLDPTFCKLSEPRHLHHPATAHATRPRSKLPESV